MGQRCLSADGASQRLEDDAGFNMDIAQQPVR